MFVEKNKKKKIFQVRKKKGFEVLETELIKIKLSGDKSFVPNSFCKTFNDLCKNLRV